jgi:hypothetical protein
MVCQSTRYIRKALEMARELIILADNGEARSDDGCAVLCGVIRDCAYKIRKCAEIERDKRRLQGTWESLDGVGFSIRRSRR